MGAAVRLQHRDATVFKKAHIRVMHIHSTTTVGDLAANVPGAARIFEACRIDYCCGAERSLAAACASAGVRTEDLMVELERAADGAAVPDDPIQWETERLADLAKHIVERHHAYTRQAIERLEGLSRRVLAAHGKEHPELLTLRELVESMAEDLLPHLTKEELILFPYIEDLENSRRAGRRRPTAPFGTVDNPIRSMMHDHDHVGALLRQLRAVTHDYCPPQGACGSWRELYAVLQAFDDDLREHMHLESDVLFPRTIEMEGH